MIPLLHTPEGVRDIYGEELTGMESLSESIGSTMRKYGFEGIRTPSFEYFDVFSSERGTVPSKDMYKFIDRDGNTLVLRPDMTPQVARAAATYYRDGKMPIRLSYCGNTFINNSGYQLRLKDIPVGSVPQPPAAPDPLLLRAVHRDGEHAPEPRAVEHLEPHHVRHYVHERLFEHRGAAARQVVADAERAGSRAPFAFDPPVLPRELVHRVGPALVVAQGVDRVARAHPTEEPQDERPEERPPLVEAFRGIPFLADPVEQGVHYLAEAREESGQLFESLFAVRRFRGPPAGALARATVFLPVLSVIAATSSSRASSLISFRRRFASAHLADQSATSGAKSVGT